ncbi:MAG: amino acid adenylation domain-containing protein, partial [Myxococcota bacterium]
MRKTIESVSLGESLNANVSHESPCLEASVCAPHASASSSNPSQETPRSPSSSKTLIDVFLAQVERVPDQIAVEHVECGARLTYKQLDQRVTAVAKRLQRKGLQSNDLVGVFLPRGIDLYVAILGVLKAGGAYLPIDVEFPPDRVLFTLEDANAKWTITDVEHQSQIPASISEVLCIQSLSALQEVPEQALERKTKPEDLCYMIYTSGTTGKPKGVCLSQQNALTFVAAVVESYGVNSSDRVLQGFSTAFDASVEEIWMAFATGATLVVGTQECMRAADELPQRLEEFGITVFSTVPTLLSVMQPGALSKLRLLIFGGEAARADVIEKWSAPGRRLMNSYGPTECTVVSTFSWCVPGEKITIGKALPGYQTIVVDEALQQVADGVEGELCVGGTAVSTRGYLGREELNKKKFFVRDGVRFYRTGDLVSVDAQGDIVFCGRIDAQVKIRGYRVELEEIETHLLHALEDLEEPHGCEGVIVAMQKDDHQNEHLVAFFVQDESTPFSVQPLLETCREKMPTYMIPSKLVSVSSIPRLSSGKVNRKALPCFQSCFSLQQSDDAALSMEQIEGTEIEKKLLGAFRQILKQPIMMEDSFFDWGGNSVSGAEVISICR